ncbi:MAG: helix-turn-helix domain-containing protein, partial [Candidatus Eisenbacteria bacterium]|nr:helix-turn-helix domain-containing protein [Candidatus Eisenbacteria bacterium]
MLRRRVVLAIRQGMGPSEAARVFGVSRQAIHNWMRQVEGSG